MKTVSSPLGTFARSAFAAIACASALATSSIPLQAAAAAHPVVAAPAANLIAQVTTTRGETVRFTLLPDGSVAVIGALRASAGHNSIYSNHQHYATPLDLFHAAAPNKQAPIALVQANERYLTLHPRGSVQNLSPTIKAAQGPRIRHTKFGPQDYSESWFINDYCIPASGTSYNVCYTDAWSWAYLNVTNVSGGHAVVYAKDAGLSFNVSPIGNWFVPQGWVWWADKYSSAPFGWGNFDFDASVSNAQTFDFEADVNY